MKYSRFFLFLTCSIFFAALFGACKSSQKTSDMGNGRKLSADNFSTVLAPQWSKGLAMYEVNTRQFSEAGTFAAVEAQLPRLKAMGIGIVWFMPITPIGEKERKGTMGSYYAVKDYKAVGKEYGTIDDFKHLVKRAHDLGMYVIIDWVANHSAADNIWASEHKDYYTRNEAGQMQPPVADWSDVLDLNYDNKAMRSDMITAMEFWVKTCDIDGFRCDVAEMVPNDFWKEAIIAVNKTKKDLFWLAEGENPELHKAGFHATYGWEMHHLLKDIAQGQKTVADLDAYFSKNQTKYAANDYRLYFTTNHDENSWNGTEREKFGDGAKAMFAVCATAPVGMPLIYTGQEAGLDKRIKFFEKDAVQWGGYSEKDFFTKLLQLKQKNKALWNGNYGGTYERIQTGKDSEVLAFLRKNDKNRVLFVANLSNKPQKIVLNGKVFAGNYNDVFSGKPRSFRGSEHLELKAWEYHVWAQ